MSNNSLSAAKATGAANQEAPSIVDLIAIDNFVFFIFVPDYLK